MIKILVETKYGFMTMTSYKKSFEELKEKILNSETTYFRSHGMFIDKNEILSIKDITDNDEKGEIKK